jgi:hypothetical protein
MIAFQLLQLTLIKLVEQQQPTVLSRDQEIAFLNLTEHQYLLVLLNGFFKNYSQLALLFFDEDPPSGAINLAKPGGISSSSLTIPSF